MIKKFRKIRKKYRIRYSIKIITQHDRDFLIFILLITDIIRKCMCSFYLLRDWHYWIMICVTVSNPPLPFIFSYIRSYYRGIIGQKPVFRSRQILESKYIHIICNNGNGKVQRHISLCQTEAFATWGWLPV